MVKTKGPILSAGAQGSIADTLIVQEWKGRSYVRKLTKPANPKSAPQLGLRVMFGFLNQQWASISTADKLTWQPLANELNISPINAFIKTNQDRWARGEYPGEAYPILEDDVPGIWVLAIIPTRSYGLLIDYLEGVPNDNQAAILHRSQTSGFTPSPTTGALALPGTPVGLTTVLDSPLDPGVYYYRIVAFSKHGVPAAATVERMATVT